VLNALILSSLILLAACSSGEKLAQCSGPVFQLNADQWQAGSGDLSPNCGSRS
jgi:outer membrane murein-binding lipoprotein Lpp